jgi:hypothetical protein
VANPAVNSPSERLDLWSLWLFVSADGFLAGLFGQIGREAFFEVPFRRRSGTGICDLSLNWDIVRGNQFRKWFWGGAIAKGPGVKIRPVCP